jgi:hypothetical protein
MRYYVLGVVLLRCMGLLLVALLVAIAIAAARR